MMQVTAQTVANEFIKLAKDHSKVLNPAQILKLVYLAHGWMLGYYDKPLINDKIEAWKYGPVIPALYEIVRGSRGAPIPNPLPAPDEKLSPEQTDIIERVYNIYNDMSSTTLSDLSHQTDTPWDKVYDKGSGAWTEIPDKLIYEFYKKRRAEEKGNKIMPDQQRGDSAQNAESVTENAASKEKPESDIADKTETQCAESWAFSKEELEARNRKREADTADAATSREQQDADLASELKHERDITSTHYDLQTQATLAFLQKYLIIGGAAVATLCFIISLIALPICWFFPNFLPVDGKTTLQMVATFGFGMICTNILEKIFPKGPN